MQERKDRKDVKEKKVAIDKHNYYLYLKLILSVDLALSECHLRVIMKNCSFVSEACPQQETVRKPGRVWVRRSVDDGRSSADCREQRAADCDFKKPKEWWKPRCTLRWGSKHEVPAMVSLKGQWPPVLGAP